MKVAVTGGAGYIGSLLVKRLIDKGFDVVSVDNLLSGDYNSLFRVGAHEKAQLYQGDIRDLKLLLEGVENFVEAHKTELDGRSRTLTHVRVGYRKHPMSLKNRLKTWAGVLERLLSLGAKAANYVRRTPEIDKERILADHKAGKLTRDQLTELGVKTEELESFFCEAVETKVAEPEPVM